MNNNDNYSIKVQAFFSIIKSISAIIGGLIISYFCFSVFFNTADVISQIFIIPFWICGIVVLINGFSFLFQVINMFKIYKSSENGDFSDLDNIENNQNNLINFEHLLNKIMVVVFFVFWFGFLIIYDYFALKSLADGGGIAFLFSFIFWGVGIYVAVKKFK